MMMNWLLHWWWEHRRSLLLITINSFASFQTFCHFFFLVCPSFLFLFHYSLHCFPFFSILCLSFHSFFFFGISFHFSALSIKKEIHHVHTLSCSFFTLKMTYPQELETPDNTNSRSWYLSLKTTTQTTTTQFNNNIISLL